MLSGSPERRSLRSFPVFVSVSAALWYVCAASVVAQELDHVDILAAAVSHAVDDFDVLKPFLLEGLPGRQPATQILDELEGRLGLHDSLNEDEPLCPDPGRILSCLTGDRNALLQVSAPEFSDPGVAVVVVTVRKWWPEAEIHRRFSFSLWELEIKRDGPEWVVAKVLRRAIS